MSQSADKPPISSENDRFVPPHLNWLESLPLNIESGTIRVPLKRIADINNTQPSHDEFDPIQRIHV